MTDDLTQAEPLQGVVVPTTVLCTCEDFTEADAQALTRLLSGRTIVGVKLDALYDRLSTITLLLDDSTQVEIGEWASFADDSGIAIDATRP